MVKQKKKRVAKKKPHTNKVRLVAEHQRQMAGDLHDQQKYAKAHMAYQKSIAAYRKLATGPAASYELAMTLYDAGDLYSDMGIYDAAEESLDDSVNLLTALAMLDNNKYAPDLSAALCNLANIYLIVKQPTIALPLLEKATSLLRDLMSAEPVQHGEVYITTLMNLAMAQHETAQLSEAMATYDQALAIIDEFVKLDPGQHYLNKSKTLCNYASLLGESGDSDKALETIEHSLAAYNQHIQCDGESFDLQLVNIQANKARLFRQLEKLDEATACFEEGLKLLRADMTINLVDRTQQIANLLRDLAAISSKQGKYELALVHLNAAMEEYDAHGEDSPDMYLSGVLQTIQEMAIVCRHLGEESTAVAYFNQGLQLLDCLNADDDESVKTSRQRFIDLRDGNTQKPQDSNA